MFFRQIRDKDGCMSYIVACDTTMEAMIVDPNHEVEQYLNVIKEHNLKPLYIVDTHTHVDHDTLSERLADYTGAKTVMHKNYPIQRQAGDGYDGNQTIKRHLDYNGTVRVDETVEDGSVIKVGGVEARVLHTPGHTQDSICLVLPGGLVLTGDTLMIGQCGRTDLPGGSSRDMYDSLFTTMVTLNDNHIIYPAHEYKGNINTSLGYERVNNPFLAERTLDEFVEFCNETFKAISDGDSIQCSISPAESSPATPGDDSCPIKNPLAAQVCSAMEYYFRNVPAHWNLLGARELYEETKGANPPLVLDVRTPEEFAQGHVPGAINIPIGELTDRVDELPKDLDRPIVAVCSSGVRSAYAAMFLRGYGYARVKSLELGMHLWKDMNLPMAV